MIDLLRGVSFKPGDVPGGLTRVYPARAPVHHTHLAYTSQGPKLGTESTGVFLTSQFPTRPGDLQPGVSGVTIIDFLHLGDGIEVADDERRLVLVARKFRRYALNRRSCRFQSDATIVKDSKFRSSRLLRIVLLILVPPWLFFYWLNFTWGLLLYSMLDPGTELRTRIVAIAASCLLFGYAGLFVWAFSSKGPNLISRIFHRPDREYRSPRWVRKVLTPLLAVLVPAFFIWSPIGPFFWIFFPYMGSSPWSLTSALMYWICLMLPLCLFYWAFSLPRTSSDVANNTSITDEPQLHE